MSNTIIVTSKDGRLELVVTPAHVILRAATALREALQEEISQELQITDAMTLAGKYVADSLTNLVALSEHIVECPIANISGVGYRNGTILFDYTRRPEFPFEDVAMGEGPDMIPAMRMFSPAESETFVAAVVALLPY